jgi:hypothetical protein
VGIGGQWDGDRSLHLWPTLHCILGDAASALQPARSNTSPVESQVPRGDTASASVLLYSTCQALLSVLLLGCGVFFVGSAIGVMGCRDGALMHNALLY